MTGETRVFAGVALGLAAGILVGLLLAGGRGGAPEVRYIDAPSPGSPAETPPPVSAPAPPSQPTTAAPRPAAAPRAILLPPPAEAPPRDERPPLVAAWFEVTVRSEEGVAPKGLVYALPAGSPGAKSGDAPGAGVPEEGPARLPVAKAGTFDVGFVSEEWGAVLESGVAVADGETRAVELRLPVRRRITFRCEPPLGPEDAPARAQLLLVPHREGEPVELPGRDAPRAQRAVSVLLNGAGAGESPPLPPQDAFSIHVVGASSSPGLQPVVEGSILVPDVERCRPGDGVVLRRREVVTVTLRPVPVGRSWTRRPMWMCIVVRQEGKVQGSHGGGAGLDENGQVKTTAVALVAGPATVEWSGDGIAAGRLEFEVEGGESRTVDLPVRFDSAGKPDCADASASFEDVALVVTGIPAGRPARTAFLLAALVGGEGPFARATGSLSGVFDPSVRQRISEQWLRTGTLAGFHGLDLASDPFPAPRQGPLTVALKPAGLLAVIPEEVFPAELGELRLRRKDGLAIPMVDLADGVVTGVEASVPVYPGLVVGPFPEGTVAFEAFLGDLRLADVSAEVKAGKIRPLVLKR